MLRGRGARDDKVVLERVFSESGGEGFAVEEEGRGIEPPWRERYKRERYRRVWAWEDERDICVGESHC